MVDVRGDVLQPSHGTTPGNCQVNSRVICKHPTLDFVVSGKSLIYIRNKMGPKTEPCGARDSIRPFTFWDHYLSPVTEKFHIYGV